PVDGGARGLMVAGAGGNPLALLELPRGLGPAELAGGFGLPGAAPLTAAIEDSFARQLEALPDQTRRLVQLAAADPSGDWVLVWRGAGRAGVPGPAGRAGGGGGGGGGCGPRAGGPPPPARGRPAAPRAPPRAPEAGE